MKTPECQVKPLSLDEAIAHAEEAAGDCDTACRREHKQLANWLRELKSRRGSEHGDTAKLREALEEIRGLARTIYSCCGKGSANEDLAEKIVDIAIAALAKPPRQCDRPECATHGEAIRTFEAECEDCDDPMEWLLAPAEEGDAK